MFKISTKLVKKKNKAVIVIYKFYDIQHFDMPNVVCSCSMLQNGQNDKS